MYFIIVNTVFIAIILFSRKYHAEIRGICRNLLQSLVVFLLTFPCVINLNVFYVIFLNLINIVEVYIYFILLATKNYTLFFYWKLLLGMRKYKLEPQKEFQWYDEATEKPFELICGFYKSNWSIFRYIICFGIFQVKTWKFRFYRARLKQLKEIESLPQTLII